MRSTEEMKQAVHRAAAKRRSRRRRLVAGGAMAIVLLVLGAAVLRPGTEGSIAVSMADDGSTTTTTRRSGPSDPSTTGAPTTLGPSGGSGGGDTPATTPDGAPTTRVGPATDPMSTTPRSSDPDRPGPTAPTTAPTTVPSTAPTTTEPDVEPAGAAPSEPGTCTAADFASELDVTYWDIPASRRLDDLIAAGMARFGYRTWVPADHEPCWTPDGLQRITITDDAGTVVFRHEYDRGGIQLAQPGVDLVRPGLLFWRPNCSTTPNPPSPDHACTAVGPGTYHAVIYDQGVTIDIGAMTVVAEAP